MALTLPDICALLEDIAPLAAAEEWDNVGLLIEPSRFGTTKIERVLLTIDLTFSVLREAAEHGAELIVAYHPPIFKGFKRLRASAPAETLVLHALELGLAVYAPHTALDAAEGGVNDWLLEAIGIGDTSPIVPSKTGAGGLGRRVQLDEALPLDALVHRIKAHLGLAHVRVAAAPAHVQGQLLTTAAVCAGSGGALFERLDDVDLYLTGEMRHHDVLAKVARGASVVLCDHTNTERGYLVRYAQRITAASAGQLRVAIASTDHDPLRIV